ncbi:MAG: 3-oxoacyl-ACP reductase [Bacteroidetes bacterium HGW-Bacteroidetes-17]|jgi:NAD(P)-dependent dehydrogenase (short-subunit alcohol dehydrogenase family)|nr:MAG: 3-oxoacyl-ACP reductase [Bacteroidetes bacterium HGW-Bacteroidetes-17]
MEIRFDHLNVLVTGASRGIGKAIASEFAASGAKVIAHYHKNAESAKRLISEIDGTGHITCQADIANPDSVKFMVDKLVKELGHIDILVNNAGIYEELNYSTLSYDEWLASWKRTMDTNLTGVANLCFLLSKHMIKIGGGKIINITSRGAFRGEPTSPAYGASKAGLNSFGQSLAKALAPQKVLVYAIAPGWVDTDMAALGMEGPNAQEIKDQSPLRRIARPEEIAKSVVMLASGIEYMTGCILDVNGASYLRT